MTTPGRSIDLLGAAARAVGVGLVLSLVAWRVLQDERPLGAIAAHAIEITPWFVGVILACALLGAGLIELLGVE